MQKINSYISLTKLKIIKSNQVRYIVLRSFFKLDLAKSKNNLEKKTSTNKKSIFNNDDPTNEKLFIYITVAVFSVIIVGILIVLLMRLV